MGRRRSVGLAPYLTAVGALIVAGLLLASLAVPIGQRPAWLLPAIFFFVLLGFVGASLKVRRFEMPEAAPARRADAWIRTGLFVAVLALVGFGLEHTGGLSGSPLRPLIYVVVAIAAASLPRSFAAFVALAAIAPTSHHAWALGANDVAIAHAGFVLTIGTLAFVVLAREVQTIRQRRDEAVSDALQRIEDDARDFRLIGAALGEAQQSESARRSQRRAGSVAAMRGLFLDVLEAARVATGSDTALLFLLGSDDTLRLAECVGDDVDVHQKVDGRGALGAVFATKRAVNLRPRNASALGYQTNANVGAFLGAPVFERDRVVGILAVDRADPAPFGEREEQLLVPFARSIARSAETERIFAAMDRAKYEHERFFEALALLNEALTIDACAERLLDAVARIFEGDFVAVVHTAPDSGEAPSRGAEVHPHRILATRGAPAEGLAGTTFPRKDHGLVAKAIASGQALPYVPLSAQSDRSKTILFGAAKTPRLESVKVLPLFGRAQPLGALVVGSTTPGHELSLETLRMLETIAKHGATTLANAMMYRDVEAMATTDGLTGLVNHRRFKELLAEAMARATRFDRSVSVVMVDADHFKSVNDTWGHPVGDMVLVRIAKILEEEARRTDVVARYGGEEFVLVLDETDEEGAVQVAERIRERIAAATIHGDFGRVSVTASLGVCTWPQRAATMAELLERADQALYEAKRSGRNRVVSFGPARCAPPGRPAIRPEAATSEPPQVQA